MVSAILNQAFATALALVYIIGLLWCIRFSKKELNYHYRQEERSDPP